MPITLSCPCGKTLRVADEHAGKRVKCPACTAILNAPGPPTEAVEKPRARPPAAPPPVPKPEPKEEEDENGRGGYGLQPAEKTAPVPPPMPEFRKRGNDDEDDEDTDDDPRRRASAGASRTSARRSGKKEAQRGVYLGCGGLAAVAGTALALYANASDEPNAMKVIVGGAIIAVFESSA